MTVTITRKAVALALVAAALAVTGTATAGKMKSFITGAEVVNGSLTGIDIKKGSLTGATIKKQTLLASHFKPGHLPAGAAGPQGLAGPEGPPGAQGAQGLQGTPGLAAREVVISTPGPPSASSMQGATIGCPAGKLALGGGGQILYPAGNWVGSEVAIFSSHPSGTGWSVSAREVGPVAFPGTWTVRVYAVCATVAP